MPAIDDVRRGPPEVLSSLRRLLADCVAQDIRFCHWKSNSHLEAGLGGSTDLDLLVDRNDRARFLAVLEDHGVKHVAAAPGKDYPGVENHVGFDETTGRLFHLHVHYSLILGQQHVKDYVLPLEQIFLARTRVSSGVPIPEPALELTVLAIRMALKYRIRDAIKDSLRIRSAGVPAHIEREVQSLRAELEDADFEEVLALVGDVVPGDLVKDVLATVGHRTGVRLLWLRTQIRRRLRPYRRMSRPAATMRYGSALARRRLPGRKSRRRRMALPTGGIAVAVIGADGSGKSTVVTALQEWLGWRLTVRTLYMGTARPSPRTAAIKRLAKTARAVDRRLKRGGVVGNLTGEVTGRGADFLLALRRLSEARDKSRRSSEARQEVAMGSVVIFDRFPLTGIEVFGRTMDGPRIRAEVDAGVSYLGRMAKREERLTAGITPPDAVLVLRVPTHVSLERSPDHDPESIAAKIAAIDNRILSVRDSIEFDASLPLADVVLEAKRVLWDRL